MLIMMFGGYMDLSGDSMRKRLGIESVSEVVRRSRLRWYGHVMTLARKKDGEWMRQCLVFPVEGVRGSGSPRKTWAENVKEDMRLKGLEASWVLNRGRWRYGLRSGPIHAQRGNTGQWPLKSKQMMMMMMITKV